MHEKYYNPDTKNVLGWRELATPSEAHPYGVGLDDDEFTRSLGWYPYEEDRPLYNENQHLEPAGTPQLGGDKYIQKYTVVNNE